VAIEQKDWFSLDRIDALELPSTHTLNALNWQGKRLAATTNDQEPMGRNR
jgi:hypothetical protein